MTADEATRHPHRGDHEAAQDLPGEGPAHRLPAGVGPPSWGRNRVGHLPRVGRAWSSSTDAPPKATRGKRRQRGRVAPSCRVP
ncbi:MAG: hypothetical protein MZW92_24615 [Comamonadaceae bacterium]|nr:hypothetical protein [Comamonadaceae bacterium]